jgi:Kef-type K+ transport system membrane component KefB
MPARAFAAGGGEADSMLVVLALLFVIAAAYLLTHFVVERLQRSFLVVSGLEYVVLGVLLGPQVPVHIPALSDLDDLMPIVALAVGWVGLLRGMELRLRGPSDASSRGAARFVLSQGLVAAGAVAGLAYIAFSGGWFLPGSASPSARALGHRELWISVGLLGCAAVGGSGAAVELLAKRYALEGETAARIRRIASFSDLLAIGTFGILSCVVHPITEDAIANPSPLEWTVLSILLGGVLGVLFTPFLGRNDSDNGRFLAMIGIIVLASGAAYFLDLSPLLVNLCVGVVLANVSETGGQIRATLESTRQPMTLVLLVFAGALWRPVNPVPAVLFSVAYVALRIAGKALGARLGAWRSTERGDAYRGLVAHGEVSVAMAVSTRLVFEGPVVDLAYTVVLVSVVVSDLFAPRILRGLLVDRGELRGVRKEKAA